MLSSWPILLEFKVLTRSNGFRTALDQRRARANKCGRTVLLRSWRQAPYRICSGESMYHHSRWRPIDTVDSSGPVFASDLKNFAN